MAQWDIDRIVREVMEQLKTVSAASPPPLKPAPIPPAPIPQPQPPAAIPAVPLGSTLHLAERVVSLGALLHRLQGVKRVVIRRGAVVTPAVRDELKQREIALVYEEDNTQSDQPTLLVGADSPYSEPLLTALVRDNRPWKDLTGDNWPQTTLALTSRLKDDACLGLLMTAHPIAALCLANRFSQVRAFGGPAALSVSSVSQAVEQIGANLLVLDPAVHSPHQLKSLAAEWLRVGKRGCPPELESLFQLPA